MFKNMKIGMRLGLGFGTVLLLMLVLAYEGIGAISAMNEEIDEIIGQNVKKTTLSTNMMESVHIVSRVLRTMILLDDRDAKAAEKVKLDKA
ncbi:MAG: MCP four helix bundle domain-containing protein, partial [Sulfuritalea sp.]|nr:MCP four helix bundle domain-containing protein [Sulfuritalea sp.]